MIGSGKGRPGSLGASHGSQESIYSDDEREFCVAVDKWKNKTGTRFPALTEYLTIIRQLGYRKGEDRPAPIYVEILGHKVCPVCRGEYPATLQYFHRDAHKPSGLASSCKTCRRARMNADSHRRKHARKGIHEQIIFESEVAGS